MEFRVAQLSTIKFPYCGLDYELVLAVDDSLCGGWSHLQVEWMSDKMMRMFEENRSNPFQFRHIMLCHSLEELAKVPDPKVCITPNHTMHLNYFEKDLL